MQTRAPNWTTPWKNMVNVLVKHTGQRCGLCILLLIINLALVAGGAFKDAAELTIAFNENLLIDPIIAVVLGALITAPLLANPLLSAICWLVSQFCPTRRAGVILRKFTYLLTESARAPRVYHAHGSRAPPYAI